MNTRPKMTVTALKKKKALNQKITLLTAYDFPMASFLDQAGIDMVLVSDAVAMAASGAFGLIIECLPVSLGEIITRSLDIPVISIGSGPHCDGQGLVTHDMLGLFKELSPRFLKVYADLQQVTISAVSQFRQEVESGQFPTEQHSYSLDDRELDKLLSQIG